MATQLTNLKTDENTFSNHLYEPDAVMKRQAVQTAICGDPMRNFEYGIIESESLRQNQNTRYSTLDVDMLSSSVGTCSLNTTDMSQYMKSIHYSDVTLNIARELHSINKGKVIGI